MVYVNDDFHGSDIGIFLLADLFIDRFYAIIGLDYFSNEGDSHGGMIYSESGGTTKFLCLGLGTRKEIRQTR